MKWDTVASICSVTTTGSMVPIDGVVGARTPLIGSVETRIIDATRGGEPVPVRVQLVVDEAIRFERNLASLYLQFFEAFPDVAAQMEEPS